VVATEEFANLAREAARSQGLPAARIATVAHPIGGASDESLREKADAAVDAVLALLTRAGSERRLGEAE
jgi:hypothetical protein